MLIEKHVSHRKINRSYQLHSTRRMQSNLFQPLVQALTDGNHRSKSIDSIRFDTDLASRVKGRRRRTEQWVILWRRVCNVTFLVAFNRQPIKPTTTRPFHQIRLLTAKLHVAQTPAWEFVDELRLHISNVVEPCRS